MIRGSDWLGLHEGRLPAGDAILRAVSDDMLCPCPEAFACSRHHRARKGHLNARWLLVSGLLKACGVEGLRSNGGFGVGGCV